MNLTKIVQELKKVELEASIGKSRGRLATKIHGATDGNGHTINFVITGVINTYDYIQVERPISSVIYKVVYTFTDGTYDIDKIIKYIAIKSAIIWIICLSLLSSKYIKNLIDLVEIIL